MNASVISDASLLIGFTKFPLDKGQQFIEQQFVQSLFPKYKQSLKKYSAIREDSKEEDEHHYKEFEAYFYKPSMYAIFGEYSLMILSIIDDYTLSSRIFHPHNHFFIDGYSSDEEDDLTFEYKVITGVTYDGQETFLSKCKQTFLRSKNRFPLIAISYLKINNEIMLNMGYKVVTQIKHKIQSIFEDKNKSYSNLELDYLLIEPFGWSEICIVAFSNSYELLIDFIINIRELTSIDFEKHPKPLFVNTNTSFGYDFDLFKNNGVLDAKNRLLDTQSFNFSTGGVIKEKQFKLSTKWEVRPGYIKRSLDLLSDINPDFLIAGRESLSTEPMTFDSFLSLAHKFKDGKFSKSVKNIISTPLIDLSVLNDSNSLDVLDRDFPKELAFSSKQIRHVRNELIELRISKILRERIINVFVNFNYGIKDPILYIYFLELKPFMDYVLSMVSELVNDEFVDDINTIQRSFDRLIEDFEKAFKNRFLTCPT